MNEYSPPAQNRYNDFITGLAGAARYGRHELWNWIHWELIALLFWGDSHAAKSEEGAIKEQITETLIRLRHINNWEFPDAKTATDDTIQDISDGGYDSLADAITKFGDACRPLERVAAEVEEIRLFLIEHFD